MKRLHRESSLLILLVTLALSDGKVVVTKIKDNSHWEEVAAFTIPNSDIEVAKYESKLTGLTIAIARAETPIVNGYFCLPTQAKDNDGLPHILEHLVFLGSEDYPYKEVLDLLANRCLASRTNAWTSTDHTCYTVYTAGTSGFLQILPIYLDHILFPTLRDEDYVTEVHHINGKGKDAGVVYSEMQGSRYSTSSSKALKRKLYPGNSGYYAETGGNLGNLRNSTTIEKVRAYHRKFYRPENMLLTITGRIDEKQLFETIRPIEDKILEKQALIATFNLGDSYFVRPWHDPLEPTGFTEDHVFTHEYPDDDESRGHVLVAFRLSDTDIAKDNEKLEAYLLMQKYLTSSKISPFRLAFVETSDPLATSTGYYSHEYKEPTIAVKFSNVPTNRTHEIIPKMKEVLKKILDDGPEGFDIERIHDYIDRGIVGNKKEIENSPHLFFPDATLLDKIYGLEKEDFKRFVKSSQWSTDFRDKNASFWLDLIDEVFHQQAFIAVEGKPNIKLAKDAAKEEEVREKRQIEELGEEGLKKKAEELQQALDSQITPSDEILSQIPLGDVNKIQFRAMTSHNRTHNSENLFDFSPLPFKVHFENVKSSFIQIYLYLDAAGLTVREQKFLPLLMDLWLNSPMKKGEDITDINAVIKWWSKVLMKLSLTQGYSALTFSAQAELDKLDEALIFLGDRINYPYFTLKEVNATLTKKLSKKLPSATSIRSYLADGMYFDNTTSQFYTDFIKQKSFLQSVQDQIEDDIETVVDELHAIIKKIVQPSRAFLFFATNAKNFKEKYGDDLSKFKTLFNNASAPEPEELTALSERFELKRESEYRNKDFSALPRHVAIGVDSTKSCYMTQGILYNNTDWTSAEVADIRVLLGYITDRFYNEVRGRGLTYSIGMYLSVSTGQVTLKLSKSSQLADAYEAVRQILSRYISGETKFDPTLMESAKGSLIYNWASKEETVIGLIKEAAHAYSRRTDSKYNRQFTKALGDVTVNGMSAAASKLFHLFMSPSSTQTVVVCSKSSIEGVVDQLTQTSGLDFTTYDKLEDTFLAEQ